MSVSNCDYADKRRWRIEEGQVLVLDMRKSSHRSFLLQRHQENTVYLLEFCYFDSENLIALLYHETHELSVCRGRLHVKSGCAAVT